MSSLPPVSSRDLQLTAYKDLAFNAATQVDHLVEQARKAPEADLLGPSLEYTVNQIYGKLTQFPEAELTKEFLDLNAARYKLVQAKLGYTEENTASWIPAQKNMLIAAQLFREGKKQALSLCNVDPIKPVVNAIYKAMDKINGGNGENIKDGKAAFEQAAVSDMQKAARALMIAAHNLSPNAYIAIDFVGRTAMPSSSSLLLPLFLLHLDLFAQAQRCKENWVQSQRKRLEK